MTEVSTTTGIRVFNDAPAENNDVRITLRDTSITAEGQGVRAGRWADSGTVTIDITGGAITTTGASGHGIVAYHQGTKSPRTIDITVGGRVTVKGADARGVQVGRINSETNAPERMAALDAEGYRMQTVAVNDRISSQGPGVYLTNGGKVIIEPRGSIRSDSGIAILATGTVPAVPEDATDPMNIIPAVPAIPPKLRVDLNLGGRRVSQAIGDDWILNDGGETTIAMNGVVLHDGATGVTGNTARNGAWNVRMRAEGVTVTDRTTDSDPVNWGVSEPATGVIADRDFSVADFNERRRPAPPAVSPPPPPPPPMPRTVMVDERVVGGPDDPAGVLLEGGGEVYIGAEGSVRAASGIAILATGDSPDLLVDMSLAGRRVANVIGDDWIINDGGGTTIVVNGVKLHDGATGVVPEAVAPNGTRTKGLTRSVQAPNGAFDVRIREEGVTVRDRTDPDPANWTVSAPATGVIADRDFSSADFIEEARKQPGQPGSPVFMEEYAPRAALYELVPDFLLRLTSPGPTRTCCTAPDEPVWVRFAGGQGAYQGERSTVGATYDFDRFETEGGLRAAFGQRATGWASVRHVRGTADGTAPSGRGKIDARGLGSTVGGRWQAPNDVYAAGCFSYMAYDVDFASAQAGLLRGGVDARAYTLDVELGRAWRLSEQLSLTSRAWVVGSRVSVDRFTDTVNSAVSFADADRLLGGVGVIAETTRPWGGGAFALRGSMDLERIISGQATTTKVSGERLRAKATGQSLLFGVRGGYRQGPFTVDLDGYTFTAKGFTVGAEIAARQELGSTDSEYVGFLNLGISF